MHFLFEGKRGIVQGEALPRNFARRVELRLSCSKQITWPGGILIQRCKSCTSKHDMRVLELVLRFNG